MPATSVLILGGDSPAILVFSDNQRYLFNCGEGTQRFCTEHKVRMMSFSHIFLSSLHWEHIGGLTGMLLSVNAEKRMLKIYGGPNLSEVMEATKWFIHENNINFESLQFGRDLDVFQDENLCVTPVTLSLPAKESEAASPGSSGDPPSPVDSSAEPGAELKTRKRSHDDATSDGGGDLSDPEMKKALRANDVPTKLPIIQESPQIKPEAASEHGPACCDSHHHQEQEAHNVIDNNQQAFQRRSSIIDGTAKGASANKTANPNARRPKWMNQGPHVAKLPRNESIISFICKTSALRGRFNPEKARSLGVTPGPLFRALTDGKSVTSSNGNLVTPGEVMSEGKPGTVFIILAVPTAEYIPSLMESEQLNAIRADPTLKIVFHLLGKDVVDHPDFKAWMNGFGQDVEHVMYVPSMMNKPATNISSAVNSNLLAAIEPTFFSKYFERPQPSIDLSQLVGYPSNIRLAQPLTKYNINPTYSISTEQSITGEKPVELPKELKEVLETIAHKYERLEQNDPAQLEQDIRVTFLGTGSAVPSKLRNVSAIHVETPNGGGLLMDCGEGTYHQMLRKFGEEKLVQVMRNLHAVAITHSHADHHLGTILVLKKWKEIQDSLPADERNETIFVVGPHVNMRWLNNYSRLGFKLHFKYIENRHLNHDNRHISRDVVELERLLGLKSLRTVNVVHCPDSYGFILETLCQKRVIYSGDTRPCNQLVQAGANADLLIHEATFGDDLYAEAVRKRHSTMSEAMDVADRMNAKFTILTHFSQRYPRMPSFAEGRKPSLWAQEEDMDWLPTDANPVEIPKKTALAASPPSPALALIGNQARLSPALAQAAASPIMSPSVVAPGKIRGKFGVAFDLMTVPLALCWKLSDLNPVLEDLFRDDDGDGGNF